jgi:hypothetical protein
VARRTPAGGSAYGAPPESPKGEPEAPIELYSVVSIRHVIGQLASLETKVDRLISDVKTDSDKIDQLRLQAAEAKGTLRAFAIIGGILMLVLTAVTLWVAVSTSRPAPITFSNTRPSSNAPEAGVNSSPPLAPRQN